MLSAVIKPKFSAIVYLLALLLSLPCMAQADARADGERGIAEYRKGNLIEGMQLLNKSAQQGYIPAQTTLAYILDAAEKNDEAFYWYQQAADRNDAAGLFGLGSMYGKGEGTDRDPVKSGQLIERAAQLGHVEAMRVYAHALEHGQLGLAADPGSAADWYLKAAELGNKMSMHRLKQAYSLGQLGLPIDPERAEAWAERTKGAE
ncbi:MAG: hypothetical protein GWP56_13845 [Gammaproteobacteria bacterium]|jgi:TPR repeat protein|nr:hypothetical protein [Gammaproteobacteria bacterium]